MAQCAKELENVGQRERYVSLEASLVTDEVRRHDDTQQIYDLCPVSVRWRASVTKDIDGATNNCCTAQTSHRSTALQTIACNMKSPHNSQHPGPRFPSAHQPFETAHQKPKFSKSICKSSRTSQDEADAVTALLRVLRSWRRAQTRGVQSGPVNAV